MQKILFWIICIAISLLVFAEPSYATTAFFTTKDGRVFCETDSFDGSYRICTKEQSSGSGLIKAERYNPRLVDTTTGRICVEDGTEIDMAICQDEIAAVNSISTTATTGQLTTPSTGAIVTPTTTNSLPVETNPLTGTNTGTNTVTPTVATPIEKEKVVIVEDGLIASIQVAFFTCTGSTGTMSCPKAIGKMTDAFIALGTFSIIGILVIFFAGTIFWFNMISHAFSHPIGLKPLWIAVLLVLSVPGAILYYFAALRPYEEMVIASGPPRPPSFFY